MSESTVYGIDLGSAYSCLAKIDPITGQPEVIMDNVANSASLPSAVAFPEGMKGAVVGAEAKEIAIEHPERAFQYFKRYMGCDTNTPDDNSEVHEYHVDGKTYTAVELSALVLGKMKQYAAEQGEAVEDVIVSFPAYFSYNRRAALMESCKAAGLSVIGTITEPAAAALAFVQGRPPRNRVILVYDLGGTFDVTLIRQSPEEGNDYNMEIIACSGDHMLGGADWDERMYRLLKDKFAEEYGYPSAEEIEPEDLEEIYGACGGIKHQLSTRETVTARISGVKLTVTREEFDNATADLLARTMDLTEVMLERSLAGTAESEITDVLLTGGCTRMPQVRRMLKNRFGEKCVIDSEPETAVARGAALAYQLFCRSEESDSPDLMIDEGYPVPEGMFDDEYAEADMIVEDTAFHCRALCMDMDDPLPNTEEYSCVGDSGFQSVWTAPLSTFGADVDTASYTTTRRKLLEGELPDGDAVRIEELINYFSYAGLAPEDGSDVKLSACLAPCPWNEKAALMFVGVGAKRIETDELPRSNIVFLIDTSGSMEGEDRLGLIQRAFALMTRNLREGDVVSIVTYAGTDRVELEGVDGARRGELMDAISRLEAWGSTNGSAGINTAYQLAVKYFIKGGNNRVILMTDGDLNVGVTSQAALTKLIEEKKQSGVFLSVFGFGAGNTKDNKMSALAEHGNGNYCYIDSLTEARRSLVEQMGAAFYTVAKDVKLQVEFNPEYVSSYRLIGYETRRLAAEDFEDDTKDGGDMGSGHTAVALYELIPPAGQTLAGVVGEGAKPTEQLLKYQSARVNGIPEVATVLLRYKQPDADESSLMSLPVRPDALAEGRMERNLRLASAAAEFGMLLRDSKFRGSATWDMARKTLQGLENLNDDETELMYLITRAKALNKPEAL